MPALLQNEQTHGTKFCANPDVLLAILTLNHPGENLFISSGQPWVMLVVQCISEFWRMSHCFYPHPTAFAAMQIPRGTVKFPFALLQSLT